MVRPGATSKARRPTAAIIMMINFNFNLVLTKQKNRRPSPVDLML